MPTSINSLYQLLLTINPQLSDPFQTMYYSENGIDVTLVTGEGRKLTLNPKDIALGNIHLIEMISTFEARIFTGLEKEINEINSMGYRQG